MKELWMDFLSELELNPWMMVGITLGILLSLSFLIERFIWKKILSLNEGYEVLKTLNKPLKILLIVISGVISIQTAPDLFKNHSIVLYGSKVLLILSLVWTLERLIVGLIKSNRFPGSLSPTSKTLFLTIFRVIFGSISLLVILDTVGVSITPILASLGVGSLAVALALQDTLGNFFSGIYLLIDEPIRIGDYIKVDSIIEGHVIKIGWRSTLIKQPSNDTVVIPNSKLASSIIVNCDFPLKESTVVIPVGVAYDSNLEQVEKITLEVAQDVLKKVTAGDRAFDPVVRFHAFADSSINFNVILRVKQATDAFVLKHEFIKALHKKYEESHIEIPFPQQVVYTKN